MSNLPRLWLRIMPGEADSTIFTETGLEPLTPGNAKPKSPRHLRLSDECGVLQNSKSFLQLAQHALRVLRKTSSNLCDVLKTEPFWEYPGPCNLRIIPWRTLTSKLFLRYCPSDWWPLTAAMCSALRPRSSCAQEALALTTIVRIARKAHCETLL